jgi:general secretion pathway protein N
MIRLSASPLTIFGAVFVAALIVLLPMRLVLGMLGVGEQGLTAREVGGSMWDGSVREAQVGRIALGDLNVALSPLPLLVGRARIDLRGQAGDMGQSVHGAIETSRHAIGIDRMTATLPTGNIFAPVPISALDLTDIDLRFEGGNCKAASGRVKASLSGDIAGISLGQGLSGEARCDAGALLLPLASQAGTERATVRMWQDGHFRADLLVQPTDPAAAARLRQAGFQSGPGGWSLPIEGKL